MSVACAGVVDLVGELTRCVDGLAEACAGPPGPGPLGAVLLELGRCVERLAAVRAVLADRFEGSAEWAGDGARSGAAWVAARSVEHPRTARGRVLAGRDLREIPELAAAVLRGDARMGHARLLSAAARAKPHRRDSLAQMDALAARTAPDLPEPAFARVVARWAALADAEHDAQLRREGVPVPDVDHAAAEQAAQRELFLSRVGTDGLWALDGTLDSETGLALATALEAVADAIRDAEDDRTLPALRHDALGVLLSGQLSAGLPVHKGVRPHIVIVRHAPAPAPDGRPVALPVTEPAPPLTTLPVAAVLLDRTDGVAQGPATNWISPFAWQRLSCDATLQTLDLGPDEVPLRLGRSARVVPPALRRVLDIRDRCCTFAGCTAPAHWCQAHHIVHWEDGGTTDERNLILLCAFHHRAVHERGFTVRHGPDGTPETLRPDGSRITIKRDPPVTPVRGRP